MTDPEKCVSGICLCSNTEYSTDGIPEGKKDRRCVSMEERIIGSMEVGKRIGLSQSRVSRHIRSGMEKIRKKYMETMYPAGTAQGMIQKKQTGGKDYAQIWNQCEGNP